MIQRQQTLWLLLATVAAVAGFFYPFATGMELVENTAMEKSAEIIAGNNLFSFVLTTATAVISAVTIFLFKNRKQQSWLCILGILISALLLVVYISNMNKLVKPVPALTSVLPVIILVSYFMALRGIRKDQKLVKSLDKLR